MAANPNERALTGAIAIIKVKGQAIGKMKNIRINEQFRRVRVPKGLGSIFADEFALVEWSGTIQCSFVEVDYTRSGVKDAIRRIFGSSIYSQIASGNNLENFEDQAVLDIEGVDVEVYKKVIDIIDPSTGQIKPNAIVYASIKGMFIDSDNVTIDEANISGRDQSFQYLYPVVVS